MASYLKNQRKPSSPTQLQGKISVHSRGFGFVESERGEIFIPPGALNGAVDGDTVRIEITGPGREGKGPEGQVVELIERRRTRLAAIIVALVGKAQASAFSPLLGPEWTIKVQLKGKSVKVGDRVVLHVERWGSTDEMTVTSLESLIGHISDPSCDVTAACIEYELPVEHPLAAVEEATSFGKNVSAEELKGREDFRQIPTVTIDPQTAKDFDDALSLRKNKKGEFELIVHVADVSHYVRKDSFLDLAAQERCNSTYFPGVCIPMLPPALADHLCSLKPRVDRLAISVVMHFNAKGELSSHRIVRSVIHSAKRFSYEEAKLVLDGKKKSVHAPLLQEMVELCQLLKVQRRERGSIEFSLPEVYIEVDDVGRPQGMRLIEYDITHQMVEEFMLKANEVVATHVTQLNHPLPYRVHEAPSKKNLDDFRLLAQALGFKLPKEPTPKDLQELFDKAHKTSFGSLLCVSFIRSMKLAIYSPDNVGHYGLSLENYCHFTSPIRRYPDLLVHRILMGQSYSQEEVMQVAKASSEKERLSARAENSVLLLKKLRYLGEMSQKFPHRHWRAVITQVKSYGIIFEVADLMLEGFIHISALGADYYEFYAQSHELVGEHTGETFKCSQPITVELLQSDLISRTSLWRLVNRKSAQDLQESEKGASKPRKATPVASSRKAASVLSKQKKKRKKPRK